MKYYSVGTKEFITPLLSIVIVNYNHGKYLDSAIQSVLNQSCKDFELIIVDGASTDNSVEVIQKYDDRLAWWVSEKDNGQSDAFNKGFGKANGEFLTWLNADDLLLPDTIKKLKEASKRNRKSSWFTGNMVRFTDDDNLITDLSWGPHFLPNIYQEIISYYSVFGPTSFFKKSIYEHVGPISNDYHYTMDTEYWARLISFGYKQRRLNHFCWGFRLHKDSKTSEYGNIQLEKKSKDKIIYEGKRVKEEYGLKNQPFIRIIGYLLRVADFSMIKLLILKFSLVGHDIYHKFPKIVKKSY